MIDPAWVSGLSALLFVIGLAGAFTRKNAIIVLMCIELMLNAANMQFAAAAVHHGDTTGWVYTIFAIAIAASEVAFGRTARWNITGASTFAAKRCGCVGARVVSQHAAKRPATALGWC